MRYLVELLAVVGMGIALTRPKLLVYFLLFSVLEPSKVFCLGNYVILGTINVKFYEITLLLIYVGAVWTRRRALAAPFTPSFLVLVACGIISLFRGTVLYGEAAFNQFRTFFSMGMFIAVPLLYRNPRELAPLLRFFFFGVIAMGALEVLELIHMNPLSNWIESDVRYTSVLSGTEGALLAMPFIYIVANMHYLRSHHVTAVLGAGWCVIAAVFSASRGVWIGITGAMVSVVWFSDVQRRVAIITSVVFVSLFLFIFARGVYIERYEMNMAERFKVLLDTQEGTAYWRLMAWRQMVDDIARHPFIGVPFGEPTIFYVYKMGYYQENAPHNEYLKIGRYTGLIGLSALLWFLCSIFADGVRYLRRHHYSPEYYEMAGLLSCFVFHLLTAAITQTFTDMVISPVIWMIPGAIKLYMLAEPRGGMAAVRANAKP